MIFFVFRSGSQHAFDFIVFLIRECGIQLPSLIIELVKVAERSYEDVIVKYANAIQTLGEVNEFDIEILRKYQVARSQCLRLVLLFEYGNVAWLLNLSRVTKKSEIFQGDLWVGVFRRLLPVFHYLSNLPKENVQHLQLIKNNDDQIQAVHTPSPLSHTLDSIQKAIRTSSGMVLPYLQVVRGLPASAQIFEEESIELVESLDSELFTTSEDLMDLWKCRWLIAIAWKGCLCKRETHFYYTFWMRLCDIFALD